MPKSNPEGISSNNVDMISEAPALSHGSPSSALRRWLTPAVAALGLTVLGDPAIAQTTDAPSTHAKLTHEMRFALLSPACDGHIDRAMRLIESGADISSITAEEWKESLEHAVAHGHYDAAKFYIDIGKVDVRGDSQKLLRTAFNYNTLKNGANDNLKVIKLLIEKGANIRATDENGNTPLLWAFFYKRPEIVKFLIEQGADKNAVDVDGNTPLILAIHMGSMEIAQLLVNRGADANAKNKNSWTPLMSAVYSERLEIVIFLMQHKADPNAKAQNGDSPLKLARKKGLKAIEAILLANNARE